MSRAGIEAVAAALLSARASGETADAEPLAQPLTHAPLPPAGVWASPGDASRWPMQHRLVESEIALRLGRDVDAALAGTVVTTGTWAGAPAAARGDVATLDFEGLGRANAHF